MTYRLGCHVQLFKNRFFIEPSVLVTHWPINTTVTESFTKLEKSGLIIFYLNQDFIFV